jgi:hypothetical protein
MYPSVTAASEALAAALRSVPGTRYYRQLGGPIDPPALVLPLARLVLGRMGPEPTEATYVVGLVVDNTERAIEQLEELIVPVYAALDGVTDAAVGPADQGTYPAGGVQLPAYLITVEVAL